PGGLVPPAVGEHSSGETVPVDFGDEVPGALPFGLDRKEDVVDLESGLGGGRAGVELRDHEAAAAVVGQVALLDAAAFREPLGELLELDAQPDQLLLVLLRHRNGASVEV